MIITNESKANPQSQTAASAEGNPQLVVAETESHPPPYEPRPSLAEPSPHSPSTSNRASGPVPLEFTYDGKRPFVEEGYDPLNPPPPSFRRPQTDSGFSPAERQKRIPFRMLQIPSQPRYTLASGFQPIYSVHLLAPYDIQPADFSRFLSDLHFIGAKSISSIPMRALAGSINVTTRLTLAGFVVSKIIQRGILAGRALPKEALRLVEVWNTEFFLKRGVNVWIRRGSKRVTGTPQEKALSEVEFEEARNVSSSQGFGRYGGGGGSGGKRRFEGRGTQSEGGIRDGRRLERLSRHHQRRSLSLTKTRSHEGTIETTPRRFSTQELSRRRTHSLVVHHSEVTSSSESDVTPNVRSPSFKQSVKHYLRVKKKKCYV